jgi:hydroxymethylpyrimidine/phosphomethylpyrimidine kinase
VLLLGGLDPVGGAGLTLDATVVAAHGCQPLPVAVVLTVQNRFGFGSVHPVAVPVWRAALAAAAAEGPIAAVKTGLLAEPSLVAAVASALAEFAPQAPWLVDPVLGATAGGLRFGRELPEAYRTHLVGRAALVLPNQPELQALGGSVDALLALGAGAVLHKGGHGDGPSSVDVLHTPTGRESMARPRLPVGPVRGTGCALASAIAARLAVGAELASACRAAGDWLHAALARLSPAADAATPRCLPWPLPSA